MKRIRLPAKREDDLNWKSALIYAENEDALFWQIDLGLERGCLDLKDAALFSACALALEQFSKEILPQFKERTRGVSLYSGLWDIPDRLVWNDTVEEHFCERLEDDGLHNSDRRTIDFQRTLFSTDLFAEFMHRLLSLLPEEVETSCAFEVGGFNNSALLALVFSRARFEHLRLILEGTDLPFDASQASVGLLLPTDQRITFEVLEKLEGLLAHFQQRKSSIRFIPELLLGEEWDGLQQLAVIPETLTLAGQRLLRGFEIAGGELLI